MEEEQINPICSDEKPCDGKCNESIIMIISVFPTFKEIVIQLVRTAEFV